MLEHLQILLCEDLPGEQNAISKALETFKKSYQAEIDFNNRFGALNKGIIFHHKSKPSFNPTNQSKIQWSSDYNAGTLNSKESGDSSSSSRSGAVQAITLGELEAAPVANMKTYFKKKIGLEPIKEKAFVEECSPFYKFGLVKQKDPKSGEPQSGTPADSSSP